MIDALLMRRFQCRRDLRGNRQCLVHRNCTAPYSCCQRVARREFHHQKLAFLEFFKSVYRGDVRIVQRRQHPRFALEPHDAICIAHECFG